MSPKQTVSQQDPVYVVHEHPIVDEGPAEWEGPPPPGVVVAPLAVEPITSEETTHPVIDGGPTEWEPFTTQGIVNAPPPEDEPIPAHVFSHPIVDSGPAEYEPFDALEEE